MGRTATSFLLAVGIGLALIASATPASANKLDLALARFIECKTPAACEADLARYERFMAEYAFGVSPKIMSPASTLGYSGFYLGIEGQLTPVPGKTSDRRWYDGTAPANEAPSLMFNPGVHVRKGLPWSFEIGASLNYLAQSETIGLGAEIKWSLFEGYRHHFRGVLPDIAARGSVMRIGGQSDIDMTIVGVDGSISYKFGVGGMISLTPYAGFQYLWTLIRIEPLVYRVETDDGQGEPDWPAAENSFHRQDGGLYDTSGLSGPNLERMKLFLGLQFGYELLSIIIEGSWGLPHSWNTATTPPENGMYAEGIAFDQTQYKTEVDHQFTMSAGVGLNF
jgi:hypothetical protein